MSIPVGWICIEGSPWFSGRNQGWSATLLNDCDRKLATARSAAVVSDDEWEWYIILTLWSPLQVIRLLEDSSEQAVRLRQNSPFVSLLPVPLAYRLIE
jgi:hypothetical protein